MSRIPSLGIITRRFTFTRINGEKISVDNFDLSFQQIAISEDHGEITQSAELTMISLNR